MDALTAALSQSGALDAMRQQMLPQPTGFSGEGSSPLAALSQQLAMPQQSSMTNGWTPPQQQEQQDTRGALKRLLTGMGHGAGQALKQYLNLPTDEQVAAAKATRDHLAAQTALTNAQAQSYQNTVMTPLGPMNEKVAGQFLGSYYRGGAAADTNADSKIKTTQMNIDAKTQAEQLNGLLKGAGIGYNVSFDESGKPTLVKMSKDELSLPETAKITPKAEEQLKLDYSDALKAGDTKKADDAIAAITALHGATNTKPPSKDDRYIAIQQQRALGKPLSPDDAAYEVAYKSWNKLSKIDPGVARANAFNAGKYIPMIDPSDPEKVSLFRAADAAKAKLGSPQSIAYQTDKAMSKYMTSGKGGANITAFNTATAHLGTLAEVANALNNGDMQGLNRLGNWYAHQTGNPAPTNFETVKSAVAGELANTFKTSGATDPEIAQITATINNANSPKAIAGAITYYQNLLGSKVEALQGQYEMGRAGKPNLPPKQVTNGMNASKGMVRMSAPNGQITSVPANQVEHFKSLGAKVVQ